MGTRAERRVPRWAVAIWLMTGPMITHALAQSAPPGPSSSRMAVGAGLLMSGGYPIGNSVAQLRSNGFGAAPPPATWFATSSRVRAAAGVAMRVEYRLATSLSIEGGGSFAQPVLGVQVSQDAEASPATLDGETLHQIVIDGGVSWQLPIQPSPRVAPFVAGSVGYLRQLHQERTRVETGTLYSIGGGARCWLRGASGLAGAVGVRADVRAVWRRHGIDFANETRVAPTATISLFVGL